MSWQTVTPILAWIHRWLTVVFAPVFLLVLVSGAVLAFRPILQDLSSGTAGQEPGGERLDGHDLAALVARLDPQGRMHGLAIGAGRRSVTLFDRAGKGHTYSLQTGEPLLSSGFRFDLFAVAERLHRTLLIDADALVEIAAFAMLAIILLGPLLAWPLLRNTLRGWHEGIGWALLPVILLTPGTAVLLVLGGGGGPHGGGGGPHGPPDGRSAAPMTLAQALDRAAGEIDLSGLQTAQRHQRSRVILQIAGPDGAQAYVVSETAVTPATGSHGLVRQLHEGTWAGAWSGALNLLGACALLALMGTGIVSWVQRVRQTGRRSGDPDADILVGYASQTGTAARLAEATAAALRDGGNRVALASLARVAPEELRRYRQVLLICSTTGEGEVPENGRAFLARLKNADLSGVSFCLLALGDRRYARFCAGGETVRAALLAAGAAEGLAAVLVDGDPQGPWRQWLAALAKDRGLRAGRVEAPEPDRPVTLTVVGHRQLNDPRDEATTEAWNVTLRSARPLDYRPGDLLLIAPSQDEPERCYSIGSSMLDDPHRIELTVGLFIWQDESGQTRLGRASGLLCRGIREGDLLQARLRRHPEFNPPQDHPFIMVATGCGIAPFIGFLAERAHRRISGKAWLFFGNRRKAADFFYADRLQRWLDDGTLSALTTAFSRDPDDGTYVQDRLIEHGREVLRWLDEDGAILYVCGRTSTTGRGVDEALRRILMAHAGASEKDAAARIESWINDGRVRRDLFE